MLKSQQITLSHLIVINIVDMNTGVNFLNHSIASVRKEHRPYRNALMIHDVSLPFICTIRMLRFTT